MDNAKFRAWWFAKQGLDRRWNAASPNEILRASGWARSVGGANPYQTIFARSDVGRSRVDSDIAATEIHELPSARGCTYVLPAEDFALGLKVGQGFSDEAAIQTAVRFLGVTEAELEVLCREVLGALNSGPLDPKDIKKGVGDAARHLGEEGKKRGQTTTLPLALGRLQQTGQIRRVAAEGRLDRQRYLYTRWSPNPLEGYSLSREAAMTELARRFLAWIGPATPANFQWFSGLGVRAAKEALASLDLVPIEAESELLISSSELEDFRNFQPPTEPRIALVSALDGLFLLRREIKDFLESADLDRRASGEKGILKPIGNLQDLSNNAIVDRGRIIGLWEYDPAAEAIVSYLFVPRSDVIEAEIERTESFIRTELGDCRSFSLDSPESRRPVIEGLKSLASS